MTGGLLNGFVTMTSYSSIILHITIYPMVVEISVHDQTIPNMAHRHRVFRCTELHPHFPDRLRILFYYKYHKLTIMNFECQTFISVYLLNTNTKGRSRFVHINRSYLHVFTYVGDKISVRIIRVGNNEV